MSAAESSFCKPVDQKRSLRLSERPCLLKIEISKSQGLSRLAVLANESEFLRLAGYSSTDEERSEVVEEGFRSAEPGLLQPDFSPALKRTLEGSCFQWRKFEFRQQ